MFFQSYVKNPSFFYFEGEKIKNERHIFFLILLWA